MEIRNGKITNVSLTMADHGVLTFYLTVEGGGIGFGYGGYCIGHGYLGAKNFKGSAKGVEAMMRIMDTIGVNAWEDLTGKYLRYEYDGLSSIITKIGHITENNWFDIKEFFAKEE